jgi:predicted phosphodiesterase
MSDIHANPTALARAVDDARKNGVDDFVCLGDFVGYGPSPNEAITLSREVFGDRVVLGNHDAAIVREMSMDSFSRRAQKSILAQRYMVDESNLDWLAARPHFIKERNLLFVHGDASLDAGSIKAGFGYVFRPEDVSRVLSAVSDFGINIVFVGHTHEPMIWEMSGEGVVELLNENRIIASSSERFVVNVGTVGCPRSVHYASYAIVDIKEDGNVDIELRKIPFDYSAYRDSLLEAGVDVPIWLEDRLSAPGSDKVEGFTM